MRGRMWLSLVVLFATFVAAADQPAAPSGPLFTTKVEGTVPDLTGRWLLVGRVAEPKGAQRGMGFTTLWDVTRVGGQPQVAVRWAKLPAALERSLAAANEQQRDWIPSDSELIQLRGAWDGLTLEGRGATRVETTLAGKDAFSDALKSDERIKDSEFIVQQLVLYSPGGNRPIKDALIYGVMETQSWGYAGNYASVTIAPTPFPIPIALKGTFRLYRLDSVAPPGLLARVLGIFSGCGRTRDAAQ